MIDLSLMDTAEFDRLIHAQANQALGVPSYARLCVLRIRIASVGAAGRPHRGARRLRTALHAQGLRAIVPVLETLAPFVHGFAASSVFEARIAHSARRSCQSLHCYSPAYSTADMESTLSLADYLSLNSLNQFHSRRIHEYRDQPRSVSG